MGRRSYDQFCSLACALDVIGDRWAPLIVRELWLGPRRYSDLARGLPGIASDMLTRRLRELEEAGVIRRRRLSSPVPATVYELTERGRELERPLLELARWGLARMPPPSQAGAFTPSMMSSALRVMIRPPGGGERLEVALRSGGEELRLEVDAEDVRVQRAPAVAPDLTLTGEPMALMAVIVGGLEPGQAFEGELDASGVELSGDREALNRFRELVEAPESLRGAAPVPT